HLAPGVYSLWLRGRDGEYTVSLSPSAAVLEGYEREPNDAPVAASPLGEEGQARGVLTDQDVDVFELVVAGEAQLYRLQAVGDGLAGLAVLGPNGRVGQGVRGGGPLR